MARRTASGAYAAPVQDAPTVVVFHETPAQRVFFDAMFSDRYTLMGAGGAIRGTKTWLALGGLIALATVYPRSRWAIVRRTLPDLRRNTIPSFDKLRPTNFVGDLNRSTWTWTCANGSEIMLFPEGFTADPELNRWKGLEVNGFVLEEANELSEASKNKAIERAGAWIIPPTESQRIEWARIGTAITALAPTFPVHALDKTTRMTFVQQWAALEGARTPSTVMREVHALLEERRTWEPAQPKPKILCTFNPADNWVRETFYEPHQTKTLPAGVYFQPLTIADNPYLTDEYRASLKLMPEREYRRFVLGDWGANVDPEQLIQYEWIIKAQRDVELVPGKGRLGVDVARYGNDETVLCYVDGNVLRAIDAWGKESLMVTANRTANFMAMNRIDSDMVSMDDVGLGGGAVDRLHEMQLKVRRLIAGGTPVDRPKPRVESEAKGFKKPAVVRDVMQDFGLRFKNIRAQMWWEGAQKLYRGEIAFDPALPAPALARLIKDLLAPHYKIDGDKYLRIESTDEIKTRIGRSPDYGTAFVMAIFDWPVGIPVQTDPNKYARLRR